MDKKFVTVNGKKLEVPELELYCAQCGTTNFFYDDNKNTPPQSGWVFSFSRGIAVGV